MSDDCCNNLNISKWSIIQLKEFLKSNSVSYNDCLEKSDFIDKVNSILLTQTSSTISTSDCGNSLSSVSIDPDLYFDYCVVGPLSCNCCLIGSSKTNDAVLVDPGGDADIIINMINKRENSAKDISDKYNKIPILLSKDDFPLYQALPLQCAMFKIKCEVKDVAIPAEIKEGDTILDFGRVIATPGHSPGSLCYYFEKLNLLISGDTLFKGSVGRTDLFGGSMPQLKESILNKLYTLPRHVKVIPGHGEFTTIGSEMDTNSVIRFNSKF